jgi:hypothetical protein
MGVTEAILVISFFGACFLAWRDEYREKNDLIVRLGLKVTVISLSYETGKLLTRLLFKNDGSSTRTVLSVSFLYRESASINALGSYPTGPENFPFLGHIRAITLEPNKEIVEPYEANIPDERMKVDGAEVFLYITFTTPSGRQDSARFLVMKVEAVPSLVTPGLKMWEISGRLLDGYCRL